MLQREKHTWKLSFLFGDFTSGKPEEMLNTTASSRERGSKLSGRAHPRHQIARKPSEKERSIYDQTRHPSTTQVRALRRSSEAQVVVSRAQAQWSIPKIKKDRNDHSGTLNDEKLTSNKALRRELSWSDGLSISGGSDASNISSRVSSTSRDNSSHGRSLGGNHSRASTQDCSDFEITSDRILSGGRIDSAEITMPKHQLEKLAKDTFLSEQPRGNLSSSANHSKVSTSPQQPGGSVSNTIGQVAARVELQALKKASLIAEEVKVLPRQRLPGFNNDRRRATAKATCDKVEAALALATLTLLTSPSGASSVSHSKENEMHSTSLSSSSSSSPLLSSSAWREEFAGITALRIILVHASWILAPVPPVNNELSSHGVFSTENTSTKALPPGAGAAALEAFVLRLAQLARSPNVALAQVHCFLS